MEHPKSDAKEKERLADILSDVRAIVFECNLQTKRFTYVSNQAEIILGYPVQDWYEIENFWENNLLHPEDRDQAIADCIEGSSHGDPFEIEYRVVDRSGQTIWVRDLLKPHLNANGEVDLLRGVLIDITREKQMESELLESETRFREIAEATTDVFWVTELEPERIIYVSPAFEAVYGVAPDKIYKDPRTWTKVIHPDDRQRVVECFESWGADPLNYHFNIEYRVVWPDGQLRWIHDQGHAIQNRMGKVYRLSGIARDITNVKLAEFEAQEGRERTRQIAEATSDVFWVAELNPPRIVYVTPSYEQVWGQPAQAIYDDNFVWLEPIHPDDREKVRRQYTAWIEDPENNNYETEFRLVDQQGQIRWLMPRGFHQVDANGKISLLMGIVRDITELKEAETRKDNFLATLAHELRNPLLPLQVGLNLLRESPNFSEINQCLDDMDRQLQLLTHVVNDLLDLSRISRGVLPLHREWTSVKQILEIAANTAKPLILEKRHELLMDYPGDAEVMVDPTRMAQVVANLLLNAAKYTPPGGRIDCRATLTDEGLTILVADNGIGVPKSMRADVFGMFKQLQTKQEGEAGLGIGLTLVKSLIELHGGQVTIEDCDGPGAIFKVQAPAEIRSAPSSTKEEPQDQVSSKSTVLVVDDSHSNARMISLALNSVASEVHIANDGVEALEMAAKIKPDVIVMDIGMPRMNGYEAAQKIRQQKWGTDIRLIALTGWGQQKDIVKVKEAGFDFHMIKPPDVPYLRELASFSENKGATGLRQVGD